MKITLLNGHFIMDQTSSPLSYCTKCGYVGVTQDFSTIECNALPDEKVPDHFRKITSYDSKWKKIKGEKDQ
jgi:uncharacterized protein (DUF2225 family)